ncbi:hypothetical protein AGMMS49928_12980 [Spirochaetia bacterium]|nr:hypothetical protein AGMMS49928_12980 [Spirochaetia bacterium]
MKKIRCFVFAVVLLGLAPGGISRLYAQNAGYNAIIGHAAERAFIAGGSIKRNDLQNILHAGNRAPSASNRQPWHFTVVQNASLGKQIVSDFLDGNALIVVSSPVDGKTNSRNILDCGLAVENIYLAAQALGYGSRIYTGPIDNVNASLKEALGLPDGYSAIAIIRVGEVNTAGANAVSTPSPRNDLNSIVNYKR